MKFRARGIARAAVSSLLPRTKQWASLCWSEPGAGSQVVSNPFGYDSSPGNDSWTGSSSAKQRRGPKAFVVRAFDVSVFGLLGRLCGSLVSRTKRRHK